MRKFTLLNKMTIRHPEKISNPINLIKKKPTWIRTKILDTQNYFKTKEIINKKKLHTVCQEASCPNISECWSKKHATFMIMGDTCTRACSFCNVKTGKPIFGSVGAFENSASNQRIKFKTCSYYFGRQR